MPQDSRTPFSLRVLGIDPAAAGATGFGVVCATGSCCTAVHFGALGALRNAGADVPARLRQIHERVSELIDEFSPQCMAIESIFSALNVKTALRLAEVRGVILLAAAQRGLPVHSYSPREVKAAVTGYGHADKAQIQQMVRALLVMKETPQPADAADALAVAICHVQFAQTAARFGEAARRMALQPAALRATPRATARVSVRATPHNPARVPRGLTVR
jgi:crossover junction endodeoxyribonuclease RuvC